jgi:hypothetical protein
MNLLMVGAGKGSWQIRGHQLGDALGARVTSTPTDDDFKWAHVCVLVKMHGARWADQARKFGVPIVWDALDCWRQPTDNAASPAAALVELQAQVARVKPFLTIGATRAMADAVDGLYLPHHPWESLKPSTPRSVVTTVAYQGGAVFLGRWRTALEQACARRGWLFVINPVDLGAADIVVALRDGVWDGWMCREWKSGVKLVNAMAAGRPVVTQDSAAWRELQPEGSLVSSLSDLDTALDRWEMFDTRLEAVRPATVRPFRLLQVAEQYRQMLQTVRATCAA